MRTKESGRRKTREGDGEGQVVRVEIRVVSLAVMFRLMASQARKHPSLIPLFIFIGAGGTGAALYIMRLALRNPDVCWDKKNNPEPWNKLGPNDQYKFYAVTTDYSKLKKEGPDY